jgi:hypothetical protein
MVSFTTRKSMYNRFFKKFKTLPGALVLAIATLVGGINSATGQEKIPACQPPNVGEYILLVISPTTDNQNQLRRALPSQINSSVCRYIDNTVTRIGAFGNVDDANRWAKYVNTIVGLQGIITTRPPEAGEQAAQAATPASRQTVEPRQKPRGQNPRTSEISFNPQPLGSGYAVLVDYQNRPELVGQVSEVLDSQVGLVSYGQRPYLLGLYTTSLKNASQALEAYSDKGFNVIIVDSRRVVMLRENVK